MRSFVPTTLAASAALLSAAQAVTITKPAAGETVDASKGFDIVWTYDSSDPTDWEIELGVGKLIATDVKPSSAAAGQTATYTYTVKPTDIADGTYSVILDPRNDGTPGTGLPQSGEFTVGSGGGVTTTTASGTTTTGTSTGTGTASPTSTGTATATATGTTTTTPVGTPTNSGTTTSVTGTPSGSVVPPVSVSSTVTSASVISSTIVSGTHTTVVPQSTVFQTTVVPGSPTASGTSSPTTTAIHTGAAVAVDARVGSAVVMALLPAFLL